MNTKNRQKRKNKKERKILAMLLAVAMIIGNLSGYGLSVEVSAAESTVQVAGIVDADGDMVDVSFDADTGTILEVAATVTVADIPESINDTTVTAIDQYAFMNCDKLTYVSIPSGVTEIATFTFANYSDTSSGTTYTGGTSLTYVQLPDTLETINAGAFRESNVAAFYIPASVTTVGYCALYSKDTSAIYFGGNSTFYMGQSGYSWATEYCYSSTSVYSYCGTTITDAFADGTTNKISFDVTTRTITDVEDTTALSIPEYIAGYLVEGISESALASCTALTSIYYEGTVAQWAALEMPSSYTTGAGTVTVICSDSVDSEDWQEVEGITDLWGDYAKVRIDATGTILEVEDTVYEAIIPETIAGVTVTAIDMFAFQDCSLLTIVSIPSGVTEIEQFTFMNGTGGYIGYNESGSLTNIYVTSTGGKSLETVILPDTITSIGAQAFYGSEVEIFNIPVSVTYLGSNCFHTAYEIYSWMAEFYDPVQIYYNGSETEWTSLLSKSATNAVYTGTTVYYNDDVISVPVTGTGGNLLFNVSTGLITGVDSTNRSALTVLSLPEYIAGVKVVGIAAGAFDDCAQLMTITLSDDITTIGESAFADNGATIYYLGTAEQWAEIGYTVPSTNTLTYEKDAFTLGEDNERYTQGSFRYEGGYPVLADEDGNIYPADGNISIVVNGITTYNTYGVDETLTAAFIENYVALGWYTRTTTDVAAALAEVWNGDCWGLAAVVGLVYDGYLTLDDLSSADLADDQDTYYELTDPEENVQLYNTVKYYHTGQVVVYDDYSLYSGTNVINTLSIKAFIDSMLEGNSMLLGYSYTSSGVTVGHSVLAVDCVQNADGSYTIYILDSNDSDELTTLKISADYQTYEFDANTGGYFTNTSSSCALSITATEMGSIYDTLGLAFDSNGDFISVEGSVVDVTPFEKTVTSIEITTAPTTTTYTEGQDFDTTGMVVTATYQDGTTGVVTGYTHNGYDLEADDTSVTITYSGKTATQAINVKDSQAAPSLTGSYSVSTTDTSTFTYTITAVNNAEYSIDGTTWQDSNVFDELQPETTYTFYIRYKETASAATSDATSLEVTLAKLDQNASYAEEAIEKTYGDASFTNVLTETLVSGDVSYASSDEDVVTVNEETGAVTIVGVGTATITATVAATATYNTMTADYKITVGKKSVEVEWSYSASYTYTGEILTAPTASIEGGSESIALYVAEENSKVFMNAGTYDFIVTTTNPNYTLTDNKLQVTIGKATNSVTASLAYWTYGETAESPTFSATFGSEASYTYSNTEEGTFTTTAPTAAGTYYVKATVEGTDNYDTATSAAASYTIKKADDTIEFVNPNTSFAYGDTVSFTVKTTSGENASFTYSANGSNYSEDAPTDVGTYYVKATVADSTNYNGTSETYLFSIEQIAYTSTKTTSGSAKYGTRGTVDLSTWADLDGASFSDITVSAGSDILDGTCSITGDELKFTFADDCANIEETATVYVTVSSKNYKDFTIGITLTVEAKVPQSISLSAIGDKTYGDSDFTLSSTIEGIGTVTYTSSNSNVLEIDGTTARIVGVGEVTITATVAEDSYYASATTTETITVGKASITDTSSDQSVDYTGEAVGVTSITGTTVDGSTITVAYDGEFVDAGTYTVKYTMSATNHIDKTGSITLTIDPAEYTDDMEAEGSAKYGNAGTVDLSTWAALDGASFSDDITVSTGSNILDGTCSVDEDELNFTFADDSANIGATATVEVTVSSKNYKDFTLTITLTVLDKTAQSDFDFTADTIAKTYGDASFTLLTSGNETSGVTYVSSDTSVISIDGNVATIVGAGTAEITATAPESDDYSEGTAEQTITVSPKQLTVSDLEYTGTFTKVYDGTTDGGSVTVSVKAASLVEGDTLSGIAATYVYDSANVSSASEAIITTTGSITVGNYTLDSGLKLTADAKITPLTVTVELGTLGSMSYTGLALEPTVTISNTPHGTFGASDYKVSYSDNKEAGTATVTVEDVADNNFNFETVTTTFTITQVDYEGTIKATDSAKYGNTGTYDLSALGLPSDSKYGTLTITDAGKVLDGDVTLTNGKLTYAFSNSSANVDKTVTVEIPVTCNNYKNFTVTITLEVTAKSAQEGFAFANATLTKVYGNTSFTLVATGEDTANGVTYSSSDESILSITNGVATILKAGTVTVTATAAEDNDYAAATATQVITISPKSITVTATSYKILVNDMVPTLAYTSTALAYDDALVTAPTITAEAVDTGKAGTYDITISGMEVDNQESYNITYVAGTLEVVPEYQITLDANGGTLENTSLTTDANQNIIGLEAPTRSNIYVFEGWFTSAENGTKITSTSVIENDMTLYAQWSLRDSVESDTITTEVQAQIDSFASLETFTEEDTIALNELVVEIVYDIDKDAAKDNEETIELLKELEDLFLAANTNLNTQDTVPVVSENVAEDEALPAIPATIQGLALSAFAGKEITEDTTVFLDVVQLETTEDGAIVINVSPKMEVDGVVSDIANDDLQTPVSFKLYLNDSVSSDYIQVVHIADDGSSETFTVKVEEDDLGKYIIITVSHFSEFQLTEVDEPIVDLGTDGETSEDETVNDGVVDTGDHANVVPTLLMMAISLGVILFIVYKRRKTITK